MSLNRVIPRVDIPLKAGIVSQVSGRAQKYPWQMHEFAKGKVCKKNTYKQQMDIKKYSNTFRNCRMETRQTYCELFNTHNIHLGKITHENAGNSYADNKKEAKKDTQKIQVKVAKAIKKDMSLKISAMGTVNYLARILSRSLVGTIKKRFAKIFTFVSARLCGGLSANRLRNMYKKKGYRGENRRRDVLGCTT